MSTFLAMQFSRPDAGCEGIMDRTISESICKATRSEICHVDYISKAGTLIGAHIQDGVRERPHDYETWGLRIIVSFPVTFSQADDAEAYARSKIGTQYDWKDIAGIAVSDASIHDPQRLICSSFCADILDNKKYRIVWVAKDHWQVDPDSLRMIVTAQPGAKEIRLEGKD